MSTSNQSPLLVFGFCCAASLWAPACDDASNASASPPAGADGGGQGGADGALTEDADPPDALAEGGGGDAHADDAGPPCPPYEPDDGPDLDRLLGWWPMQQDTKDQSANGHDCTQVGDARLVQDAERGTVLELDGDGDYLDCGNDAALNPTGPMTLALWVRVRSFHADWQSFFSRNGETCGWNIRRDASNAGADFVLRGTSSTDDLSGSHAIDDGKWHHIAGTFDGSRRVLYVDGAVDAQWDDAGTMEPCAQDHILIGAMGGEAFGYGLLGHDGWLDDVRIYDVALDEQGVRRLAGTGRAAHSPEPADGTQCVDADVVLHWQPGLGSCAHHVYLGEDASLVEAAQDPNVPPGRGVFGSAVFHPGSLALHTTYTWRVDEVTAEGIERGPTWSFRVCGEQEDGFVRAPAGSFVMGASPGDSRACRTQCGWPFDIEKPHTVHITRDFWVGATEVTHGEWIAAFGSTPGVFAACGDDCPVENVTWWQTLAYCNQRSVAEGLVPCYFSDEAGTIAYDMNAANARQHPYWVQGLACPGYRLPTEAEWEYAARAGTTTPLFLGGASDANLQQIAWYGANSQCSYPACEQDNCRSGAGGIPPSGTHPVGTKGSNPWGLFDTSGNVWELVWDPFGEYHDGPVNDPVGPVGAGAGFHVARGGSWLNGIAEARASARDGNDSTCDPDNGPGCHTGLRIVRTAL